MEIQSDVVLYRGDVELTIGTVTLNADEAEFHRTTNDLLLRGNVRLTAQPHGVQNLLGLRPAAMAPADGTTARRLRHATLTLVDGTLISADEVDYDTSTIGVQFQFRGDVRVQKAK
jgi:lipopolysaccharide assembly outer membrane protein LptD (OstA)